MSDLSLSQLEKEVLTALATEGSMTVDQYVTRKDAYVNTIAPVFHGLRKRGLAVFLDERIPTSHGSTAKLNEITAVGWEALRA